MKTVLITGCSSGIGRALALAFHRQGFIVYASARQPASVSGLEKDRMHPIPLDVTDEANVQSVIEEIKKQHKRLDILVNNAGFGLMGPVSELKMEEVARQFHTNVFAPVNLIQQAVPLMKKTGKGIIVNIGSVSGVLTTPFAGAYCASKAALHAFSDALRMELAPFNISVVTVQPGAVSSRFGDTAADSLEHCLTDDSCYLPVAGSMRNRANASQETPTSAEAFAECLVNELNKTRPASVIRIGKKSFLLPFLKKWLPNALLDRILSRKFRLDRL